MTSRQDNADDFVLVPDFINLRDKTFNVKELMMSSRVSYSHFRRVGNEWKNIGGNIPSSKIVPRIPINDVCEPCKEYEYKQSKGTDKKYKKWYDLITLSFREFMAENPGFKEEQVAPQRWHARQRAKNDPNFSYWLHKNGLV